MTIFADFVTEARAGRVVTIDHERESPEFPGEAAVLPLPKGYYDGYHWSMPNFVLPSFREFKQPVLDLLNTESFALWREAKLPLPYHEYAMLMPVEQEDGPTIQLLFHVIHERDGTILVTPFQKVPGYMWLSRMRLTLRQGADELQITIWAGDQKTPATPADQKYAVEFLALFRSMTYLIAKAPTAARCGSSTLTALNRTLPYRKKVPRTTVIMVDVARLANPQAAPVVTARVMRGHSRKAHERVIRNPDGTVRKRVNVRDCKANGGGPDRDYYEEEF